MDDTVVQDGPKIKL